jgi:3'(2'), 5'-bisphosphate nucleotidase
MINSQQSPTAATRTRPKPKLKLQPFSIISLLVLTLAVFFATTSTTIPRRLGLILNHLTRHHHHTITPSTPQTTITMTSPYARELEIAQLAVQRAAILTKRVFHEKAKGTVSKDDASPVTIGDFGAQALIIAALRHNFPGDAIVAEEESAQLRADEPLRGLIWGLVEETKLEDEAAEGLLGGALRDVEDMLEVIDLGRSEGGRKGRVWTLDPIDGTKGFLRGGQYALALALLEDGDVKVGVLGCPNLPVDDAAPLAADIGANQTDDEGRGVIFSAVIGQGATSRPLSTGGLTEGKSIKMKEVTEMASASFCESVESGHSNQSEAAQIAQKLGITNPSVRMDSQAKYGSIARGAGDIYLRLPTSKTYQEKIWDHAGGDLIVREAGGQVTDTKGRRLDFGVGRTLASNSGVIAAPAAVHAQVLDVVQDVLGLK